MNIGKLHINVKLEIRLRFPMYNLSNEVHLLFIQVTV